jgi:hypothetical protein
MRFIEPLIGFAGALLAAVLGALVSYLLGQRRASDRSVLELWRAAFDRPAFKGPYQWHSDQERFREAIELTIQCVNTGILQNRKGTVIGTAKPKAQLKNPAWRLLGEDVERRLNRIRESIPAAGLAADPEIVEALEKDRKKIIESLNAAWKRTGLPLLPLPSEAETIADVFDE